MKATLKFDTIEDKTELLISVKALDLSIFLKEFNNNSFRNRLKYDDEITEDQYKIVDQIRDEFISGLTDIGLLEILD